MFTLIGKSEFGRINGLYQILETLLTQYPHLMLECCGGGGNRIDLGSLKRTHTCWCSDTMSHPHLYHAMLLNANILLPSNYLGSWMRVCMIYPSSAVWRGCRFCTDGLLTGQMIRVPMHAIGPESTRRFVIF